VVALFALLLAAAPAPAAVAPSVGDAAPVIAMKDVKDREVAVPVAGQVMVLSFASKSTGETAGNITREVRVAYPEATILSFIDLSGFPGFLQSTVKGRVLARQPQAVTEARDAYLKAGKTPPDDLDARIHIITDFQASAAKAYGATDTGHQAQIVVIGTDGKVKALFAKTPAAGEVKDAVAAALGRGASP